MRATRLTLLPLALCLTSVSALAATVYKWTDENGVVHYSDQPNPRAKEVEVETGPAFGKDASAAPATAAAPATSNAPSAPAYSECVLYQPENDETFPNTTVISGSIRITPALQPGHRVAVALDNRRQTNAVATSTGFTITEVERGTHTIFFAVEDAAGKQICRSEAVTIHVRQPTLLSPARRRGS